MRTITDTGFQFLMCDSHRQLWTFLGQYIRDAAAASHAEKKESADMQNQLVTGQCHSAKMGSHSCLRACGVLVNMCTGLLEYTLFPLASLKLVQAATWYFEFSALHHSSCVVPYSMPFMFCAEPSAALNSTLSRCCSDCRGGHCRLAVLDVVPDAAGVHARGQALCSGQFEQHGGNCCWAHDATGAAVPF
eukprot:1157206-Pelagomonas_calceolata.AAC.4